jgi:integrase
MQSNEAGSNTKKSSNSHRAGRYQKVLDARKRAIRALWVRNDRYYAQLSFEDPATGKKSVRRVALLNEETKLPVASAAEAVAALERLKVQRVDKALPVLARTPKLSDYVATYVASVAGTKRPATLSKEKSCLELWVKDIGETRVDRISKPMITAFMAKRVKGGFSKRTANLDLIALRHVLRKAIDDGWIKTMPTENIRSFKSVPAKRSLITHADIEAICNAAFLPAYFDGRLAKDGETGHPLRNAQQFADYLRLLAYSGARRNEALKIRWADVDFDGKQLVIGWDGSAKNHEARTVDMNKPLEAHLQEMKKRRAPDSQWLFPSPQRGDKDASTKTFKEALRMAKAKAGLPKFGFHDCRHHFLSLGVMAGVDFMTLAKWAGHKDGGILIGKVYGHLADEHKKAMADRMTFTPQLLKVV